MHTKKKITVLVLLSLMVMPAFEVAAQGALQGDGWFTMPFRPSNTKGKYIYFVGGYNSEDRGSDMMGSIEESANLYFGDKGGDIEIAYTDGTSDMIPLIYGYTMWFKAHWSDGGAPFRTRDAEPEMAEILNRTLYLQGGIEGEDVLAFKVEIQDKNIREIKLIDNPHKMGVPVFFGGYLLKSDLKKKLAGGKPVNAADPFFATHTIDSRSPKPNQANINRITERIYTYVGDFKDVPSLSYPAWYKYPTIEFTGDDFARILTHVYHDNLEDIVTNKIEPSGIINESSKNAPSWRYGGFGTWVPDARTYYGNMYSRNRSLGILSQLNMYRESLQSVYLHNNLLMYYPQNNMRINGKRVPGHWSVIPNKPMEFSKIWVEMGGMPTRYTKERFGVECCNFGNNEPDGHGMTMMDIANVWLTGGASGDWVNNNWEPISEAVHYIDWAMKNPDVSFNENGLMYGESEGGMMDYTMFNNVPCYLGVRMYTMMAEKAGRTAEAREWKELADGMEQAILKGFSNGSRWNMEKFGFHHDPSMPFWADYVGYDVYNDVPPIWYNLAWNTFRDDLDNYIGNDYIGPRGLAYDHNFISQTALLLDKCEDYNLLVTGLASLCYAPRLPKPFLVPEAATYSREKGLFRRQGDLGNYQAQNETLRTILLVAGVSRKKDDAVKLMPRLPKGWGVNISELTISGGGGARINYSTAYPVDNTQDLTFVIYEARDIKKLLFRAGPFTTDSVTVNGKAVKTEQVGDARWAWVTVDDIVDGRTYNVEIR